MTKKILVVVFALFALGQLSAQMVTDRPDQTESSATVGNGNLQIESGIMTEFGGSLFSRDIACPSTLFRYGIGDKFELRLQSDYVMTELKNGDTEKGMDNIQFGFKYQLYSNNGTEVAFLSHASLPTATALPEDSKAWGAISKIAVAHELTDNLGIGYNLGYDYFNAEEGEESMNGNLFYSLVLGVGVTDKVAFFVETYGDVNNLKTEQTENQAEGLFAKFDAGVTYAVKDNLQFDMSFGTGINYRYNFISCGVSWLIAK